MLFPSSAILSVALVAIGGDAKTLWSSSPASTTDIIRTTYPIGNGVLGAMPIGPAGAEQLVLNVDSLWGGGPFEDSSYTGGNPSSPISGFLGGIRDWIFTSGTGNVSQLLGSDAHYGCYRVLGTFSVELEGVQDTSSYRRELNLTNGVHTTTYTANDASFIASTYCSFPDQTCVYNIQSDHDLPSITVWLENQLVDSSLQNQTCEDNSVRLRGVTQLGPPSGMIYDAVARVVGSVSSTCAADTGRLTLNPKSGSKQATFLIGASTNFDQSKGTREFGYSFMGEDPGPTIMGTLETAARKTEAELREAHENDFQNLSGRFTLDLPDPSKSAGLETSAILDRYDSSNPAGDPYLESLLFDLSRYLFISASRNNSLPPNLQGIWNEELYPAFSADYHSNINIQMNHWNADQTGLGELQSPLWNYFEKNWVPRGSETAHLLYDAPGWVVHDEMNIFGHTAMKSIAQWANYPIAPAWMMQHVWDHFDYSQDVDWLRQQGYPLMKGVAEFWLSQLTDDRFFNDGSIVAVPCNSAEHGPTTFACAHYQQLIHQVFETVLISSTPVKEQDTAFVANLTSSLKTLDKGLHIGSFGQIKEWKLPDSYGYDFENDTHRHLSDLVGWFPGYSLSSYQGGFSNKTIQDAVATKLYSRGIGNGPDANAGWEKVWRSACWARLNNTEEAYFELRYAIDQNFAANALSMYTALEPPFQIDANYGMSGAMLSMLIVDLPLSHDVEETRRVVLGPAIPSSWAGGSVKGLRLRGGGQVDFGWDSSGIVRSAVVTGRTSPLTVLNVLDEVIVNV